MKVRRAWYATRDGVIFTDAYHSAMQVRRIAKYGNAKDDGHHYGYTWRASTLATAR